MSNLEWLNQQIEETKKSYDAFVLDYELFHRIGDKRDADKLKEILKRFQQIKCELEAWKVVKPAIKSKLRVIGKYRDKMIEVNHREYNEGTTEYQALKKALEVENDISV